MKERQISDRVGQKLFSISFIPEFTKPTLIYDILKEKETKPEIKVYADLAILDSINFNLYAKPIPKKMAWAKRQKVILHLRPAEAPIEDESFKKLKKLPANHFLELDIANQKVKLLGPFAEKGVEWMFY